MQLLQVTGDPEVITGKTPHYPCVEDADDAVHKNADVISCTLSHGIDAVHTFSATR